VIAQPKWGANKLIDAVSVSARLETIAADHLLNLINIVLSPFRISQQARRQGVARNRLARDSKILPTRPKRGVRRVRIQRQ
jgi:hypothetical protein